MQIGTHRRFALPFAVAVLAGDYEAKVAEATPFVDSLPNVPFTETDVRGNIRRLSDAERQQIAAEWKAKREKRQAKRAKEAAFKALSSEEQSKIVAKKEATKAKRAETKAAKDAANYREPHTFVPVVRQQAKFIPPPALDKPAAPPPVSPTLEAEAMAKLESEETRKARLARLEAYKTKPRPAWLIESNSQRKDPK